MCPLPMLKKKLTTFGPCKDIVREILVIGLFGQVRIGLLNVGRLKERGRGYVERFYINVSLNTLIHTSHKNVNQV